MRRLHGFSVVVTDNKWVIDTDDYSAHQLEDENYIVIIQHPRKENIKSLRSQLDEKIPFVPNRHTEGSFVIINKQDGTFIVGRDRTAASHLYYFEKQDGFIVSTDSSFILQYSQKLDAAALDLAILRNNKVFAPFPLIKGCKAIQPGHYLRIKGKCVKEDVFWKIKIQDVPKKYEDAVNIYGELLEQSIKDCINSDNVGVYLSGGSDSAIVMGGLNKLGIGNVKAVHMKYPGNFEFEDRDCELLKRAYNFDLQYVTGGGQTWEDAVKQSILNGSINSLGLTLPTYLMMGEALKKELPAGSTVLNGELCLLDVGNTTTNDRTRGYRRWLYRQGGRNLARIPKIIPNAWRVDWDKHTHYDYPDFNTTDKLKFAMKMFHSILYSMGRPAYYYMGMEIGIMSVPGPNLILSLLPKDYNSHRFDRFYDFFFQYENGLRNQATFEETINTMLCSWYSEMENFTMANDAAAAGNLSMAFPFSSVKLMDFAASLPTEWAVDKKIQKDCCVACFDMPKEVAYRKKDHSRTISYSEIVYPFFKEKENELKAYILDTNWGVLNEGIRSIVPTLGWTSKKFYAIWALSLWINEYNLTVE